MSSSVAQGNLPSAGRGVAAAAADRALSVALASGQSPAVALAQAARAQQVNEQLAAAGAKSSVAQLSAGATAAVQGIGNAAGAVMANAMIAGGSPEEAVARAAAAQKVLDSLGAVQPQGAALFSAGGAAPGNAADAALAQDDQAARSLGAALGRGQSVAQAIETARKVQQLQQQADRADARSPAAALASGRSAGETATSADGALAVALSRGLSPQAAAERAELGSRLTAREPLPAQTLALVQGTNIDKIATGVSGENRAYTTALNRALSKGDSIESAVAQARRAEQASAVSLPLPGQVAELVRSAPRNSVRVVKEDGSNLPAWLQVDPQSQTVRIFDAPQGALPMKIKIQAGQRQVLVEVDELARGNQSAPKGMTATAGR